MNVGAAIPDRYQIEREVGRGSFGVVYLAHDREANEPRAIKLLLPWAQRDDNLRRRLRREAKLGRRFDSPHAVHIFGLEETADDQLYIVMEYLEGRELSEVLREEGPLPVERVEFLARQILSALAQAHDKGVVHRDLKPHNIFLCRDRATDDYVKIFDFGIAKFLPGAGEASVSHTAKLTVDGGVLGTPVYMSPEQCRGEALTPASDLYSLGIVLYELLTGSVPFDHDNPVQILVLHNTSPLPPLPEAFAATRLGKAIVKSLSKKAEDRFASAREFLEALGGPATVSSHELIPEAPAAPREVKQPVPIPPGRQSGGKSPPDAATLAKAEDAIARFMQHQAQQQQPSNATKEKLASDAKPTSKSSLGAAIMLSAMVLLFIGLIVWLLFLRG